MSKSISAVQDFDVATPIISVVLPVYNGGKYLPLAIDSILAQTFSNFELIMIDDGSIDNSAVILRKYERCDSRVRVEVRENKGLAATLNDSIDIARGAWIARMDQDDIALPQRFERQLAWLEKTGADISGSWLQRFGTYDKRIVRLRHTDQAIKMMMLFCSPIAHPTVMMRTELVRRLRYDSACAAEDYDLWVRAAEAGWKMTNVQEVLLLYRVHSAQFSNTSNLVLQHGQEIRRRYWKHVCHTMRLNQKWIDEALKIIETSSAADMDAVDALFSLLLQQSQGESRDVIFENVTRLYFRAAANCPNIVSRWGKINREFGVGWRAVTKFQLWLFRFLNIYPDSVLFKRLRNVYVWRGGQKIR